MRYDKWKLWNVIFKQMVHTKEMFTSEKYQNKKSYTRCQLMKYNFKRLLWKLVPLTTNRVSNNLLSCFDRACFTTSMSTLH